MKQKAKIHNDACAQRVKRRLAFEQEAKENLRLKIIDSISSAEERRKQRVASIKERNAQHQANATKAKVAAEAKAHTIAKFHAEAAEITACARLRQDLERHAAAKDFDQLSQWMRATSTLETARAALKTLGAPNASPRLLLAVACMALDAESTFSESDHDVIMRREATRFHRALLKALRAASTAEEAEVDAAERAARANEEGGGTTATPFSEVARRASRFYKAWSAHDKPHTLDQLMASVVAKSVRQREQEGRSAEAMEPPEETLAQIRRLGGVEAEAEARRRFHGSWQTVATPERLEQTVMEVAQRAFWDAIHHHVSEGNLDALFSVLGELQGAMRALIAHAPRALAELDDKFDVAFLKQQADHGALDPASVHGLMRYVAATIAGWHAPADDAEARAWVDEAEASIRAHERDELPAFVLACLLPFLRGAQERLQRVYQRMLAFAEEQARQRMTEETLAAAEAARKRPRRLPRPPPPLLPPRRLQPKSKIDEWREGRHASLYN